MRALALKGWWQMEVVTVDDPVPAPDSVVVDVIATGICGSDIHGFTGENGRRRPGQIMGHETVGRIAALGEHAEDTDLGIGDLVTINPVVTCGRCPQCLTGADQACPEMFVIGVAGDVRAAFAEKVIAPLRNIVRLAEGTPVEYGALVEPLAVGYHALRRGGCRSGEDVLVIGGGPIGQSAALAAQRLGAANVLVSEPDARRRELLDRLGVTTIDPNAVESVHAAVTRSLGGLPTLVVDAVGNSATIRTAVECSPYGARIVLVGMASPAIDLAAYSFSTQERSLIGSFCYSRAEFEETADWVSTAPASLHWLIEDRVGFDGANESFTTLANGTNPASKVLILPGM